MTELEIVNEPVEFTLTDSAGNPVVVRMREIGSCKRRAIMQAFLIRQLISEIRDKADAMYPDNVDKRLEYIDAQISNIPSGQAMIDKVSELKAPIELIVKIIKAGMVADMSESDIEALITSATVEEVRVLLSFVKGGKKK